MRKAWIQIQESIVQSVLNAGIQMLASAALNFLKEGALFQVMEQTKTAIAAAMGIERVAAQKAEVQVGAVNAMGALAQIGGVAEASTGIAAAVVTEMAGIYAAIAAGLAAGVLTAPLAPPFAAASAEIAGTGMAAVGIAQGAIQTAIGTGITAMSVPMAASGGIVEHATLLVAGEAGREAIVPLDKGGSGFGQQTIIFQVDSRDMTTMVLRNMPSIVRMQGVLSR
jgi:hypothetical protein